MTQSVIQTQVENKRLFQKGTRKTKETSFERSVEIMNFIFFMNITVDRFVNIIASRNTLGKVLRPFNISHVRRFVVQLGAV